MGRRKTIETEWPLCAPNCLSNATPTEFCMRHLAHLIIAFCLVVPTMVERTQAQTPTDGATTQAPAATKKTDEMDPKAVFEELFGTEIRRVRATSDGADDLELAKQLLGSAESVVETPRLLAVIGRNVINLSSNDMAGLETVRRSLALLRKHEVPLLTTDFPSGLIRLFQMAYVRASSTDRPKVGESFINLLVEYGTFLESIHSLDLAITQYRRAELVATAIRWPDKATLTQRVANVTARKTLMNRVRLSQERFRDSPGSAAAASELLYFYTIELNDAASAKRITEKITDAALKKKATLALAPVDTLTETDALLVADWYESWLSRAQSSDAKVSVLTRATTATNRYLTLHAAQDLNRLKVKVKHDRLVKELETTVAAADADTSKTTAATPAVIDLGKLVDVNKHVMDGEWRKQGSQVAQVSTKKGAILRLPVVPEGDYEFTALFTRSEGDKGLGFTLPVGDTGVMLFLSWSNRHDGLSRVNGSNVQKNPTTKATSMTNKRRMTLVVRVVHLPDDEVQIGATLNGQSIVNWKGPRSALSPDRYMKLPHPFSLGLNGWQSKVVYHSLKLRMIKGKAKMVDDAAAN